MLIFNALINLVLLVLTPSMLLCPKGERESLLQVIPIERLAPSLGELVIEQPSHRVSSYNYAFSAGITYDEILDLVSAIDEDNLEEPFAESEVSRINQFIAEIARKGILEEDCELESDIENLLCQREYFSPHYEMITAAFQNDGAHFILCKKPVKKAWDNTKKFVKKHKKAIIIGAVVVVATVVVVCVVTASAGTAAGPAAAGAASTIAAAVDDKNEKRDSCIKKREAPPAKVTTGNSPEVVAPPLNISEVKQTLDTNMIAFKEKVVAEKILESRGLDSPNRVRALFEKMREAGSSVAHQMFHEVARMGYSVTQAIDVIKERSGRAAADSSTGPSLSITEKYQEWKDASHKKIDAVFATDQFSKWYDSKAGLDGVMSRLEQYDLGMLPPPGSFNILKFRNLIKTPGGSRALAEGLGFTAHQIAALQKSGSLEKSVSQTFETIVSDRVKFESFNKFDKAQDYLKAYKEFMPEEKCRELIHQTGIATFPRPAGIPKDFRTKLSNKGAGIKYVHPENHQTYIRVMPGKPHAKHLHQQKPYIIYMKDGKTLDKIGRVVAADAPEAHIPINEFKYKN